jgi:endonuclease III
MRTKREASKALSLIRDMVSPGTTLEKISKEEDSSPFKVLISTILSARTRDPSTEKAAARLFEWYPDAALLSKADRRHVTSMIRSVGFYNDKAKRIIQVARLIEEKYAGRVPSSLDELLELPGVGRKVANCVLVYAFQIPAIPVDVHVHRISNRIGLVSTTKPEDTEIKLSEIYEKRYWLVLNELFVRFGQLICKPIIPRCKICSVRPLCNYYQNEVRIGRRASSF